MNNLWYLKKVYGRVRLPGGPPMILISRVIIMITAIRNATVCRVLYVLFIIFFVLYKLSLLFFEQSLKCIIEQVSPFGPFSQLPHNTYLFS